LDADCQEGPLRGPPEADLVWAW